MMNNTNLISRKSLADEVAEKLQQQIAFGTYKVDEKLPIEPELMLSFGVGRSTIREAIKILVNCGLLRVQQGIGTFVENSTGIKEPLSQRLKRADFEDLNEVRHLLEMKVAEKAALNRTKADLVKIYDWLKKRDKAAKNDLLEECIDADIQFHISIAEASGNEILIDLYKSVAIHMKNWFLEVYKDTKAFKDTSHQHKQLVKSIEAGDAKKAWNNSAKIIGHISQ